MRKLLIIVALVVATASPAVAAASVPFWWWSPTKAETVVVRSNPQKIDYKGHDTTILDAKCAGYGPSKTRLGHRVFHEFNCLVHFHDDELDVGPLGLHLFVVTSKATRSGLACWSRSHEGIVKNCKTL